MRRARASSWDESYAYHPGRGPGPGPAAHSYQSSGSSGAWPVSASVASHRRKLSVVFCPPGARSALTQSWGQQAARAAPVAAMAMPYPAGPFGGSAWGGQSYDGSSYDSSYGYDSMARRMAGPGAGAGQGVDSLGQTYGSADVTGQPTGSTASSLGAGGWPRRYSLSRSRSAPSTVADGESALNEAMMSGSSVYSPSEPSLREYPEDYGRAPPPPRTPRQSRRRPPVEEDLDGSLFKPSTTGRRTAQQAQQAQQAHIHRALSDSNLRQSQFDDTFSSRAQSPAPSWGAWAPPRGVRASTPHAAGAGPFASTPARSRAGRGGGVRRALHFSDDGESYEEPPTSAGVSGYAPSAPWSTPSTPVSPRYDLPLVHYPGGGRPSSSTPARGHGAPRGADYYATPMVPVRAGWLPPSRLENRFGTGAVISAMVYPDATVASASYQRQPPLAQPMPLRHGWFRVSETGREWGPRGPGPGRVPLDATLASTPAHRPRHHPRTRPVPRAGVDPRRLSFSDNSSDWSPSPSSGRQGQTEPQVEFPPSSPSSAYDTSYQTAPSSAYSDYHSFH
ncbi:Mitogen-activated protein kinase 6 [Frankliniella fusca]|uniref:Mitogen-activated protein kinase 6 n=1 Tax=Frankliniella fusca TaxID=407009 RepID=A0AAE1HW18_9NEOP|nr:Mitogen-activated protein kinase 6 [Frankliniella fusca]